MADNGIVFELGARNISALAANFRRSGLEFQAALKTLTRESARELHALAEQLAAKDTGFMADHLHEYISPNGYAFEVGWAAVDFIDAGFAFYPFFVEFGTRYMAAQPALGPAADQIFPRHRDRVSDLIRRNVADFGRGG